MTVSYPRIVSNVSNGNNILSVSCASARVRAREKNLMNKKLKTPNSVNLITSIGFRFTDKFDDANLTPELIPFSNPFGIRFNVKRCS